MNRNEGYNINLEHPYPHTYKEEKKNKWALPVAFIVIALLFIVTFIGLYQCYNRPCNCENCICCEDATGNKKPDKDVPELDPNAGDYVAPEPAGPAKGVAIPGWDKLIIPAGQTNNITVDFYNPAANEGLYYLTFELRLPNNSEQGYEVLYKSGLIEADKHIQSINLSRALSAGEYDAIIHVQPYRVDDKTITNNADLKTKLVVK